MGWLAGIWKTFAGLDGLAKFFNGLLQLWREQSANDVGARLERLKMREAEAKANAKSDHVKPVRPADIVARLRDSGEEF